MTVLVVEDEPGIRDFLSLVLAEEGFRVTTAGDGLEALRLVEREPPAIVLTDLMMPRLDGYGLIARLRAARLPVRGIIAMSAVGAAGQEPLGADLFLAKPFAIEQLLTSIHRLLVDLAPD